MRCALVLALEDPRSSGPGMWIDAVTWLRQELTDLGYRVAVIDGEDVEADVGDTLEGLTAQDEVFVHVSGRIVAPGVICTAGGRRVRLRAIADALAAHEGGRVSIFAELAHSGGSEDAQLGLRHVSAIFHELDGRGYAALAAVRAESDAVEGLALTRVFFEAARTLPETTAVVSAAVYERIAGSLEGLESAQHFAFVSGAANAPRGTFEHEPLPSFENEPASADQTPPLPAFESEPLPSFGSSSASPEPVRDQSTLDEQIAEATKAGDSWRVVELRQQRVHTLEPPRVRVRELVAIARILQVELHDAVGAIDALEQARLIDPMRTSVLQALRRGYERVGRWEDAFKTIGVLADLSASTADRAELRLAQAEVAIDQLYDRQRAIAPLQRALAEDRAQTLAREVSDRFGALRAELAPEAESGRAIRPIEAAANTDPDLPELGPEPIDIVVDEGNDVADPSVHASAFAAHERDGRTDAAFLAALALEELGAADPHQQVVVSRYRSVAPIRARGKLDAVAWDLLRLRQSTDRVAALFSAVARAAVATRLEQLVERKRLVTLDPSWRLDDKSTASIVRSFQWSAQVLGVPCPSLYVVDEVPGEIAAVRAQQPTTALAPSALRGRSAKELAFLAGRHLTYYVPEHQVLVYYPTGEDLHALLAATLQLGGSGAPGTPDPTSVDDLRARLERKVTKAERTTIEAARQRLDGEVDLGGWARSVELTACRAGLLLCGDLATAAALIRAEVRPVAGLTQVDRRYDLIAFVASPEHAELRARYFVTGTDGAAPTAPMRSPVEHAEPPAA